VFTGIVRDRGRVVSADGRRLVVETSVRAEIGDSVAVDGVCLTAVAADDGRLSFDVAPETESRAKPFVGEVNVEPAVHAGDALGEISRQDAEAGADLEHDVVALEVGEPLDHPQHVLVDEEVLPELAARRERQPG
jgi:riboflavin synthase